MDAKVSIVIITKDTKELLENLLKSINEDLSLKPYIGEVIIVDNASTDGTEAMIRENFTTVIYVRNETNMGFAFSANKGFSLVEDEYVFFLNSDTILIQGELEKMIRFMDSNVDVGICGPQLVYPDMRPQRSVAAIPSLWGEFLPQKRFKVKGPKFKVQTVKQDHSQSSSTTQHSLTTIHRLFDVDSLIGAAILVRQEVVKTIDGFDERFFFFLEETDLCVRMWQAGYRVVFFPEARIIHLQGKTVRKSWIKGRMEYNISLNKFIRKHHSVTYYAIFIAVRFIKSLFLSLFFPLVLFGEKMRIKYMYYVKLVSWYLKGCPENVGLSSNDS